MGALVAVADAELGNCSAIRRSSRGFDDRVVDELHHNIKGSPPGVGYDPVQYWRGGPEDPEYHVIRIEPWRIQLVRGSDLRSIIWQLDTS
ncbi:hypothetical protein ACM01_34655 [Streptomyces viridochromogenes]|uniref:Uncharacterized protein n=1 Tax=Streptomyces viridochromogenes TaxID=1938 RepID=A0A0J8BVJ8_STRVR|nr:hypothetical protein [Streptomyces viridochromogenes]KMS69570.1 hypothetical protein ACM01_34655 [Streptomyces viridochromogenes]KOG14218.1 hypothetical protein ADK35_31175 [Streptomyces viridochromogenes]KOG15535.1 hypothetical protein ADK36_29070 [Streptomyces viridochromogenes]